MEQNGPESAYPAFVRFTGAVLRNAGDAGERLVSRSALRLHVYAVLASIAADRPGLVSDGYLDAVQAETATAVAELCRSGLWARVAGGYRVAAAEVTRMMAEVHRQLVELTARCRAAGGHEPDDEHPAHCRRCGVLLGRS